MPFSFRFPSALFGTPFDAPFGTPGDDVLFSRRGAETIDAGAGDDVVFAGGGDDVIRVGAGRDTAFGGAGDDLFVAGAGRNRYFGDGGTDTVEYAGAVEDYDFDLRGLGATTIRRGAAAAEGVGTDRLIGVEVVRFAGGFELFLDGRNNAGRAMDDVAAGSVGAPFAIAAADLLANDRDFDGDALRIAAVDGASAGGAQVSFDGTTITYDGATAFASLAAGETALDTFTYTVDDGRGGTDSATVTITVTGVNDGPVLAGPAAVTLDENVAAIAAFSATDVDGDAVTFSIAGGDDAALFAIDAATGALSFRDAPDFEAPGDADGDNVYAVTVAASDGNGGSDAVDVAVTVTDVDEGAAPAIVVSEIMYNPASAEDDWEWVEIVNVGPDALDLAGWVFDDGNSVFQAGANIAAGAIAAGGTAILYNADDVGAADFAAAWGAGLNLIAVTGWSRATLNNGGDTLALWSSFDAYSGDQTAYAQAVVRVDYDDGGAWPADDDAGSIYLTDLDADPNDGADWALSADGDATPVGTARTAAAEGGNSGADVGSPGAGGAPEPQRLVINEFVGSTPSTDVEFVELFGAPGTSLAGLSLLVIESDEGASVGRIDFRYDLATDAATGVNGFYLLGNDLVAGQYGVTPDAVIDRDAIENSSYTLALVETASAGAVGDVAGAEAVLDAVGVTDGGADDAFAYGAPVIGPDGPFLPAGAARVADGADTDTAADFRLADFGDQTANTPTAAGGGDTGGGGGDAVRISAVQGSGAASPLAGQTVTVTAIVVGDFQTGDSDELRNLNGFWLQEEAADGDGDAATSEGVFVFDPGLLTDVALGDRVTVTGTVSEFFGATQINADAVSVTQAGAVADVSTLAQVLTLDDIDAVIEADGRFQPDLEAYEGMLVRFADMLTVNETFELDRFNQVRLTVGDRPEQYTQGNDPDAAGFEAYARQVGSDEIVFDDGLGVQNAAIFPEADLNGDGVFDTSDGFGQGDTIAGLTGVLDFSFSEWRVRSVEDGDNVFADAQTRTATPPDVGGTLTISSFNVLNFFTTLDVPGNPGSGPGALEPRGADSVAEYERQLDKLLTTLHAIDADVFGLVELENEFQTDQNGDGLVALDVIVRGLNDIDGAGAWASVDPGRPFVDTGDAISVGMIYKTASVSLVAGSVEILDDSDLAGLGLDGVGPVFDGPDTNRAPLAATFVDVASGEDFTVAVAHMKSKGGSGDGADADQGDGAGAFDATRTTGVQALTAWLDRVADEDRLVLGDFNAYAQEDPIDAMRAAGYENLEETFDPGATTFVFDGLTGTLDYAFANEGLRGAVTGAAAWQNNSNEPDVYDYDLDFGRDPAIFDGNVPFRASDHDPLLVGLDFGGDALLA